MRTQLLATALCLQLIAACDSTTSSDNVPDALAQEQPDASAADANLAADAETMDGAVTSEDASNAPDALAESDADAQTELDADAQSESDADAQTAPDADAQAHSPDASPDAAQPLQSANCTLWDSLPPTSTFRLVAKTATGFALADGYQVYVQANGEWTQWLTAPTSAAVMTAPLLSRLVAGTGWIGAVLDDGKILRSAAPPLAEIGAGFGEVTATAAYAERFWLATRDGRLRVHDGTTWTEVRGASASPIIAVAESAQGMFAFTAGAGYTRDETGFHGIAVPTSGFVETATAADGTVFVLASGGVYRIVAGLLTPEAPGCTPSSIAGGHHLLVSCGDNWRSSAQSWKVVAGIDQANTKLISVDANTAVVIGPNSMLDYVLLASGIRSRVPRIESAAPPVAAIGGRSGAGILVGGSRGVFRFQNDQFTPFPGTSTLDVQALWEQPSGTVLSVVRSALKSCTQNQDCDNAEQICVAGVCSLTRSSQPGEGCDTMPCPQGTVCARPSGFALSSCWRATEIHETTAGSDERTFRGAPFDNADAIYANDSGGVFAAFDQHPNGAALLYQLSPGGSWRAERPFSCSSTSQGITRTHFVPPNIVIGSCGGQSLWIEYIASASPSTTSAGAEAMQLTDPLSVIVVRGGFGSLEALQRTSAGYLPIDMPLRGGWGKLDKQLRVDGPTHAPTLTVRTPSGTTSRVLPFPELKAEKWWSTDGWTTAYARARAGGLLRCDL